MPPEERAEANSLYAPPGDTEVEGDFSVLLVLLPRVVENPNKLTKDWAAAHNLAVANLVRRRRELANEAL